MTATIPNSSLSSFSPVTSRRPTEAAQSVVADKAPAFEKLGDPVADALTEAFAEALASGLEAVLNEAIEAIANHLAGGEQDAFDQSTGPTPNLGSSQNAGATQGSGAITQPTVTSSGNSPQRLDAVLDQLNVEKNRKYLPTGTKGNRVTHCNEFAQDALKNLGVPKGKYPTGMANDMNRWFNTQGAKNGWRRVTSAEAQAMANQGKPTVATWKNPTGVHGHIGMIRPGQLKNGSPAMAQAGGTNFNKGTVRQGFGSKQPEYFVYEGPRTGSTQTLSTSTSQRATVGASGGGAVKGSNDLSGFRSDKYDSIIREMSAKYGVPARLIKSVIEQESKFIPTAGSPKGARGLMQLMPPTAREMGVKNPLDPRQNIEGGTRYLARMLKMFKGDVPRALAAYNAGPGNVIKHRGIPPFRETQTYVRNIMGNYNRG